MHNLWSRHVVLQRTISNVPRFLTQMQIHCFTHFQFFWWRSRCRRRRALLKLLIGICIHKCYLKPDIYFSFFSLSPQFRTCSWRLPTLLQTNMTPQACGRKMSLDITSEHVFASWKTLMVHTNTCLWWVLSWGFWTQIFKDLDEELTVVTGNSFFRILK